MYIKTLLWGNGILLFAMGLALLIIPKMMLSIILTCIAIQHIISSIYIFYIVSQLKSQSSLWLLFTAVGQLFFAGMIFFLPRFGDLLLTTMVVVFGLAIVSGGVWLLTDALRIKNLQIQTRWVYLIVALAVIILGFAVMLNTRLVLVSIVLVLGVSLITLGLSLIWKGFMLDTTTPTPYQE